MNFDDYTDVYFLRSVEILKKCHLNPYVRAQVFLRQASGLIAGLNEVEQFIQQHSQLVKNGGQIFSLGEKELYRANETVLLLEGRAQDVIPLETIILGIISSRTTELNDHHTVDFAKITQRMQKITTLVGNRSVFYFGARHWHYQNDQQIAQAAFRGGAAAASTEIGAKTAGQKGVGTIPHSLENVFAWKYGKDKAVVETTKAFDQIMNINIPRVALVDYANQEIDDALATARLLGGKLYGVRVDTGGENVIQGASTEGSETPAQYWYGKGVTISGVLALRTALDSAGYQQVKIILSSGFGNLEKVEAFVAAEKKLGRQLFDSLGVGNLFEARIATMDIVGVGEDQNSFQPISKFGRSYKPNSRLKLK